MTAWSVRAWLVVGLGLLASGGVVRAGPNVVLIVADDLGYKDLSCYGSPLHQTPHLDRLASDGIRFENAYCNSPMCVPSRMSFLSGRYSSDIGVWDNGSVLRREIPSFA
ncbi:MAG: sulfatase-like hydrolase/transferase, partial [Planctomycetota bacterium]